MPINWINLKPPKAEPECGFHGDTCKNNTWRYILVGFGVAFIILIVGAFLFKLNQLTHRIRMIVNVSFSALQTLQIRTKVGLFVVES